VGFEIYLDHTLIGKSSNQVRLKSQIPFTFESNGSIVSGLFVSKIPASILCTKYVLFINGTEIGTGYVKARNWYITYSLIVIIFAAPFIIRAFK
jgi:aspartyl-tRNA synthetase